MFETLKRSNMVAYVTFGKVGELVAKNKEAFGR